MAPAHEHPAIAAALEAPLPLASDLTRDPPTNQGRSSSCTAHALVKGVEIVTGFRGSMHALYSVVGAMEGSLADNGRECVDCLAAVRTSGLAPFEGPSPDGRSSDVWTAEDTSAAPPNVSLAVTAGELALAREHLADLGQHTIDPHAPNLSDLVVASLASGAPVYLGTQVGGAFEDLGNGTVAQPDPAGDPSAGGHALLIVGHRTNADGSRDFLVENSWGEAWSGKGECWASLAWVAACWELHPLILAKPDASLGFIGRIVEELKEIA